MKRTLTCLKPVTRLFVCCLTTHQSFTRVELIRNVKDTQPRHAELIEFFKHAQKGTNMQSSGNGAIRMKIPLQKPKWDKTK